uniref:Uncharacterized protein n=1 Tax=Monodelphis domestica TaxID=13616 RepID=F7CKG2_MONDO
MNECSELAPARGSGAEGPMEPRPDVAALQEDVEMSSGSSGNETNENDFSGRESPVNDSDENGKDSAMLVESSESHKSSSNAFSLMIGNSDHNPSTSGCSSEPSAKARTQKELIKALKELKGHLPPDRKAKGKPSMLATLKYALRSIKQIKANEDYYQLLMTSESPSASLDVPSFTVKEVETLTSEYIVKNGDMFAMAVSLVTGKIVYASAQAASILPCRKDALRDARFVEFLAPHDVSVFHSSTAPSRLPAWSVCRRADSPSQEYMEEKSFFCPQADVGRSLWQPQALPSLGSFPARRKFRNWTLGGRAVLGRPSLPSHLLSLLCLSFIPSKEETSMAKVSLSPAVLKTAQASGAPVVGAHLTSLALPGKAESVVSLTSQCSYSSTLVHVGDKKLQPESEMIEDPASGMESLDSVAAPSSHCDSSPEQGPPKKVGLTKEVLAAHTQKEEQSFLHRFKETRRLSAFQSRCHYYLHERSKGRPGELVRGLRSSISGVDSAWKKTGKNRKQKSKRLKPQESSDSTTSGAHLPPRSPLLGLNSTAWSPSDTSQASCPLAPLAALVPPYPLPVFPSPGVVPPAAGAPSGPQVPLSSAGPSQHYVSLQPPPAFPAPLVAVVLPAYTFPALTTGPSGCPQHPACPSPAALVARPERPAQAAFPSQTACPARPARAARERGSPPLFQSRCSSPLQLNLLQLEDVPKALADGGPVPVPGALGGHSLPSEASHGQTAELADRAAPPCRMEPAADTHSSDALSVSSDFLDILLAEDGRSASSGSGASAASESLGSGSLGCGTSGTGTGGSETSRTSKYFGSVDSSENDQGVRADPRLGEGERLMRSALQDPIWLLMAGADQDVMMTYQAVLKEDRERLKLMQKFQPRLGTSRRGSCTRCTRGCPRVALPRALDLVVGPRLHVPIPPHLWGRAGGARLGQCQQGCQAGAVLAGVPGWGARLGQCQQRCQAGVPGRGCQAGAVPAEVPGWDSASRGARLGCQAGAVPGWGSASRGARPGVPGRGSASRGAKLGQC